MTKEQYIELKAKGIVDLSLAWEMYNDTNHPKARIEMSDFMKIFPIWINLNKNNVEKYWGHYDKKFEIK
jgi:hypothetical protein